MKGQQLYIIATADRFELPLAICDTVREAAEFLHTTQNSVMCRISRQPVGGKAKVRIFRVDR